MLVPHPPVFVAEEGLNAFGPRLEAPVYPLAPLKFRGGPWSLLFVSTAPAEAAITETRDATLDAVVATLSLMRRRNDLGSFRESGKLGLPIPVAELPTAPALLC